MNTSRHIDAYTRGGDNTRIYYMLQWYREINDMRIINRAIKRLKEAAITILWVVIIIKVIGML